MPPGLARVIAQSVREQLLEPTTALRFPLRPPGFQSTFRQRQRARSDQFAEIAQAAIAERYGTKLSAPALAPKRVEGERYTLNPSSLFDRQRVLPRVHPGPQRARVRRAVSAVGNHIDIAFSMRGATNAGSEVQISGLRKYMPDYETLALRGRCRIRSLCSTPGARLRMPW